jgi:hypothetical protein
MGRTVGRRTKVDRSIHKITKRQADAFRKNVVAEQTGKALLGDGGGLYLRALAAGTASWVFRYEIAGRAREHGLGSADTFDLEEARERARACRKLLYDGIDPIAERRRVRAAHRGAAVSPTSRTFKYCVLRFLTFKEAGWCDKHRREWEQSLERWAFPKLGTRLVDTITTDDVLEVLKQAWETRTETM